MLATLTTGGHFCAACGELIIELNSSRSMTDHIEVGNAGKICLHREPSHSKYLQSAPILPILAGCCLNTNPMVNTRR